MIRAIVSDFGGVLTTPLFEAFGLVQRDSGLPVEALGKAMARVQEEDGEHPLFELEKGRITEPEFLAKLERGIEAETGRHVGLHEFSDRYWSHLHPNEPIIERMVALRAEGYRMALLTNNVREWEPRWRSMLAVDDIFELVVDSAFVGMRKPDPEIYELTVQRLGVPATECLFLDDIELNCETARQLGMTAVWFQSNDQALADIDAALISAR